LYAFPQGFPEGKLILHKESQWGNMDVPGIPEGK